MLICQKLDEKVDTTFMFPWQIESSDPQVFLFNLAQHKALSLICAVKMMGKKSRASENYCTQLRNINNHP